MLQLNFTTFPELKTKRLILRHITENDLDELFFLRSNEEVLKFIGREPAKKMDEVTDFIKTINDGLEKNEAIMWANVVKDNPSKLIGTICYWRIQNHNYRAELGYMLHPKHWRKGIMKEVILKVIEYGFEALQFHSIEARIHADNKASTAVLESTGFVQEGI